MTVQNFFLRLGAAVVVSLWNLRIRRTSSWNARSTLRRCFALVSTYGI